MLKLIKSTTNRLLSFAGYSLTRNVAQPYNDLLNAPRYEQRIVTLEGMAFKIADPLSFRHSYKEIFGSRIYEFACERTNPRIIDCGSNYGTSVVYFKTRFPDCIITAIECDPEIHRLLEWNISQRNYRDVILLNKAVSTSRDPVSFSREGADAGRVGKVHGAREIIDVETVMLDSLLTEPVDFLKLDIEGEETSVICESKNLHNVAAMFIEYHSFITQKQQLNLLLQKLTEAGFRYYIQTQFCATRPLLEKQDYLGMDLQLNIFARRE